MSDELQQFKVSDYEKLTVIVIFGLLALTSLYKNNFEAAVGFSSTIAIYVLSREGV